MPSQLLIATVLFASIALYTPRLLESLTAQRRLRRPHPHLVLVFRLWFGALCLASLWLLFHASRPEAAVRPHP